MLSLCTRFLSVFLLLLLFAGNAFGEGYGLYEYSARGVALGGSVVARKPDASAVAYNPALLARLPGVHAMGGLTLALPYGKMDTWDKNGNKETTGLRDSIWAIPHFYYTHQINDKFTFGIGEFSRFGLGFEQPHNWPGRFNIYEVNLQTASLNPNIAWAATDKLSLAAGLEIVYVNLDIKKRGAIKGNLPPEMGNLPFDFEIDSNIQDASTTGLGFNVAGHFQFNDQWAFGALYRSQARVHAKGEVEYTLVQSNGMQAVDNQVYKTMFRDGKAHSTVILPDSLAMGLSFTPIPELSFEVSATWTRWSMFRFLNIHVPDPIGEAPSKRHWQDTWRIGVGVEYTPWDWLALRVGYIYDQSPMTEAHADYLVPTHDRDIYSVGIGLTWNSWKADFAYAMVAARQRSYRANDDIGVLKAKTHNGNRTDLFTFSLSYEF